MTFWQLEFQKYALILAGFLAGWARLAIINESRPGENLPFIWHIFQDISQLALSIVTFQKVRANLGKIPLNPPFSKGEPIGMPCLIEKLLSRLQRVVRGGHKARNLSLAPLTTLRVARPQRSKQAGNGAGLHS